MFMQDLVRFRPSCRDFACLCRFSALQAQVAEILHAGFSALQAKLQRFLHVYAGFSALQAQVAEICACLCRI